MNLSFEEIINATKAKNVGLPFVGVIENISSDTRTLKKNDLYIALKGDHFDGHQFVAQALGMGAIGVVISDEAFVQSDKVCLLVSDTLQALGDIAHAWRLKFNLPVVAITGSAGKTTTKDMMTAILSEAGLVCKTEGNLNNLIGLPKTVFKLNEKHQFAVLEMGMNAFGEIARLTQIASPTVGLITNVARAHLEGLGSIEGVAKAKGELFKGLSEKSVALVNADDPYIRQMPTPAKTISFGLKAGADIWGYHLQMNTDHMIFSVKTKDWDETFQLPFVGEYLARNWLASVSVAYVLKISPQKMQAALKNLKIFKHRGEVLNLGNDMILVDDCYNANPEAMQAAFEAFKVRFPHRRKIVILGDMFELGEHADLLHVEVGKMAREAQMDLLWALGDQSKNYVAGFRQAGGVLGSNFSHLDELVKEIKKELSSGDAILVKGSRGAKMERVIDALFPKGEV